MSEDIQYEYLRHVALNGLFVRLSTVLQIYFLLFLSCCRYESISFHACHKIFLGLRVMAEAPEGCRGETLPKLEVGYTTGYPDDIRPCNKDLRAGNLLAICIHRRFIRGGLL
jgi:hypothetical protein